MGPQGLVRDTWGVGGKETWEVPCSFVPLGLRPLPRCTFDGHLPGWCRTVRGTVSLHCLGSRLLAADSQASHTVEPGVKGGNEPA